MKQLNRYINEALIKTHMSTDDYVDLDLPSHTLWCTCNFGATKPNEVGGYYAWGEMETKNNYHKNNYRFYSLYGGYFKYTNNDKKFKLELKDDVVYKESKGKYKIPSWNQVKELMRNTRTEYYNYDGVSGIKFISLKNDNKFIFIPTGGRYRETGLSEPNTKIFMMSADVEAPLIDGNNCMYGYAQDEKNYILDISSCSRYEGQNIRPVVK